jgi:putative endonuclease
VARNFYVYILANKIGGTLYIGVTNDLIRRVAEHRSKIAQSFTKRHDVTRLVYFECFDQIEQAIHREKRLKKWTRANFADREKQSRLE